MALVKVRDNAKHTDFVAGGMDTGAIVSWSNSTVPGGFLECDGSAVSRSTYADLFAIIGTDHGSGDGSSTFNLPNLQDKVAVGASGSKSTASTGGAENVTPSGSVSLSISSHTLSTSEIPSHNHFVGNNNSGGNQLGYAINNIGKHGHNIYWNKYGSIANTDNTGSGSSHSHGGSGSLSANAMSVMQPYLALKYIIKT